MKIVIVEDELNTLNGISHLLSRLGNHYQLVGTARKGLDGMRMIKGKQPDLVITDIVMPKMNGLEMMANLRRDGQHCMFVILSGHADFHYAKEAIQLGGADYLLKPITVEDLQLTLKKAEKVLHTNKSVTMDDFLYWTAFSKKSGMEQYLPLLREWDFDGQGYLGLIAVQSDASIIVSDLAKLRIIAAEYLHTDGKYALCSSDDNKLFVFLITTYHTPNLSELGRNFHRAVQSAIRAPLACSVCKLPVLEEFPAVMDRVLKNLNWNLSLAEVPLIDDACVGHLTCIPLVYPQELENKLIRQLGSYQPESALKIIDDFFKHLAAAIHTYSEIRDAVLTFATAILYKIRKESFSAFEALDQTQLMNWINRCVFLESMRNALANIVLIYVNYNNNITQCQNPIVLRMMRMVSDEYANSQFSLDQIAIRLNVTPEHLSQVFAREIGIKFTAYLTQVRIDHAKKLLILENLKIYQIAEMTGFSEVSYFCRVFKKCTGQSPGDYVKTLTR